MASTKSISAISTAMKTTVTKKENMKKVFQDLQSHSSTLASFTLQWKDLEEHFDGIEQSIQARFEELQEKEKQSGVSDQTQSKEKKTPAKGEKTPAKGEKTPAKGEITPAKDEKTPAKKPAEMEAKPRPELKSLCSKLDARGLRSYIIDHRTDSDAVRSELPGALRAASDPAKFVLDCVDVFYAPKGRTESSGDVSAVRWTCIVLLKQLSRISPVIKNPVRERAKKLAEEWKKKVSMEGETPTEAQAFLQLLSTYGLSSSFKDDELCDIMLSISRRKHTPELCRELDLIDKMPHFVEMLIKKGKQMDAINYIYTFELMDKFPPVPLLKAHLKETKEAAQKIFKNGKNSAPSQIEATKKELNALRAIIRVVEERKLDSEYPLGDLWKQIHQLEKDKKRTSMAANAKSQQQQANKKPRTAATSDNTHIVHAAAKAQPAAGNFGSFGGLGGFMGDRPPPTPSSYLGSGGPYGVGGPGMMFDRPGSSFGSVDGFLGFNRNRTPPSLSWPHLSSMESLGSGGGGGLYDQPLGYGGYSLPGSMPPPAYRPSYP